MGKTEKCDYTKFKCLNIQGIRKIFEKNIYNKYDLPNVMLSDKELVCVY